MNTSFYSEVSGQLLFTVFDSSKTAKSGQFRVHHHAGLELGCILSGEGFYHLENERYHARPGDLFLVRANEQHCVPTITTPELLSFNIHIAPYFLWNLCADFIAGSRLQALVNREVPIRHHFPDMREPMEAIRTLAADPEENRFEIRHALLTLLMTLTRLMLPEGIAPEKVESSQRLDDVQHAVSYIHAHLTEPITLEEIARAANMSRSHLSTHFKAVTGMSPYSYLLNRRVERAVSLLHESDASILTIAQESGFENLANFNKTFKRITGMTPRDFRAGKCHL